MLAELLSCVQSLCDLTVACQAPLFMGFSRQEYWNGLPFPTPGNLPDQGIKPMFLAPLALTGRFFKKLGIHKNLNKETLE